MKSVFGSSSYSIGSKTKDYLIKKNCFICLAIITYNPISIINKLNIPKIQLK